MRAMSDISGHITMSYHNKELYFSMLLPRALHWQILPSCGYRQSAAAVAVSFHSDRQVAGADLHSLVCR